MNVFMPSLGYGMSVGTCCLVRKIIWLEKEGTTCFTVPHIWESMLAIACINQRLLCANGIQWDLEIQTVVRTRTRICILAQS